MDKITIEQADKELQMMLDKYDWFYDTMIEDNAICVYVHKITADVQGVVPMRLYGHFVKVGFASYLTCGEKYNAVIDLTRDKRSSSIDDVYCE